MVTINSLRVPDLDQLRTLAAEVVDITTRVDTGAAAVVEALSDHVDRSAAAAASAAVRELRDLAVGALLTADNVVDNLEPFVTSVRMNPDHFTQALVDVEVTNATAPLAALAHDLRRLAHCSRTPTPASPASPPQPSTTRPPRPSSVKSSCSCSTRRPPARATSPAAT